MDFATLPGLFVVVVGVGFSLIGEGLAERLRSAPDERRGGSEDTGVHDAPSQVDDGRQVLLRVRGPERRVSRRAGHRARGEQCVLQRVGASGTLGIVGESGCGKSVTLRALCGLVPAAGQVRRRHRPLRRGDYQAGEELARFAGREALDDLPRPREQPQPGALDWHAARRGAESQARLLRAKPRAQRRSSCSATSGSPTQRKRIAAYPHELSGGMRQRVMIAMAIACRPQVLLADEPTTALDVTTQEQILKLLLRLQDESGMAIILVTHDLGVVEEVCDEVVGDVCGICGGAHGSYGSSRRRPGTPTRGD